MTGANKSRQKGPRFENHSAFKDNFKSTNAKSQTKEGHNSSITTLTAERLREKRLHCAPSSSPGCTIPGCMLSKLLQINPAELCSISSGVTACDQREREDLFSRTGKSHKTERRIISEGHSPRLPSLLPDARPRCQRVTHTGGGSRSKNISSNFQQDEFPREVPSVCLSRRNRVIASRRAFYCSLFTCGSTCVESPSPLILSTTRLEH